MSHAYLCLCAECVGMGRPNALRAARAMFAARDEADLIASARADLARDELAADEAELGGEG